jgi:DNA-binding transcriptional LysR family regulator
MSYIDKTNLNVVDLNLLIVFDALYKEQNVTRAGERIGLAQPSVSSALKRLRALMDDPLFVRRSHRMVPTARAEQLVEPISLALHYARHALSRETPFDPMNPGKRRFVIAVSDYTGLIVLPSLISLLRSRSPKLSIEIEQIDRSKLDRQIQSNEVDVAIGGHLAPDNAEMHVLTPLFKERFVCIRAKSKTPKAPLNLEEFLCAKHMMFRSHKIEPVPCVIDQALAMIEKKREIATCVPHISTVPFIVANSDLIATISQRIAVLFSDVLPIEICELPIDGVSEFDISMQCSNTIGADRSLQWFRNIALEATTPLRSGPMYSSS